jgi:hypothetical protein
MREVLSVILRTVGPGTVGRYLGFALGAGCGPPETISTSRSKAHESVGRDLPKSMCREEDGEPEAEEEDISNLHQLSTHRDSTASTESKTEDDVKVGSLPPASSFPVAPSSASSVISATATSVHRTISNASTIRAPSLRMGMTHAYPPDTSSPTQLDDHTFSPGLEVSAPMSHFYGFASDKIGEACACWLSRWGMDVLAAEADLDISSEPEGYSIFRHRGIPASFLRGLLSSDSLWVKGEMERYEWTRKILDMRRQGWEAEWNATHLEDADEGDEDEEGWEEWDEDEEQLGRVFADGIYYSHMVCAFKRTRE